MIYIKFLKYLYLIFCFCGLILLVAFSDQCVQGVIKGLYISANVIIPSLFPFGVIVLIILRSNIKTITDTAFVFLLSIIGGYPVGAQLIEEIYKKFMAVRDQIETEFGAKLEWIEATKACRILATHAGDIKKGTETWNELFDWYMSAALKMRSITAKFDI